METHPFNKSQCLLLAGDRLWPWPDGGSAFEKTVAQILIAGGELRPFSDSQFLLGYVLAILIFNINTNHFYSL